MNGIILRKEQGAVAVLVAILMVAFILCIALVVDLGHLHNVKVQLQRAADAAALAGARQLDGNASQDSNATAVARATAALNMVDNKTGLVGAGGWVDNASVVVDLGTWNTDHAASSRFTSPADPNMAKAIKVTATLLVDHYFFFFTNGTNIIADAIAVNAYEETAMPIALLSCIPATSGIGSTIEDIKLYKFSSDPTDTAGWTTLTYRPISGNQLKYFFTKEGNSVLNQILYGTGTTHKGLENEPIIKGDSTYNPDIACGDRNDELDVQCGLGDEFETPSSPPEDPLDYDPLPRWNDTAAFERIWSMDGILKRGYVPGENPTQYETRLEALKTASATNNWSAFDGDPGDPYPLLPLWARDGRFDKIIGPDGGDTIAYYDQALHYAGYPSVDAKNGADNAVIQEFIDLSTESGHFKGPLTDVNAPLDEPASPAQNSYGGGDTFAVTIPVIFAGVCGEDGWKALKGKYYSGLANLLITRLWKNQNDCYDAANPVTVYGTPPFDYTTFSPKLNGDQYSCVTGSSSGAQAGFEALITPTGEEGPKGVQKIYLVE